MHKNAKKAELKIQSKICCHYTWLPQGQICPVSMRLSLVRSFLTASKPSGRPITEAKRKEKEKKGKAKKKFKNQKA